MAARRPTRTLFVTGKGGAGKSFVAAELAREGTARGMRVAVVEASVADAHAPRPSAGAASSPGEPWTRIVLDPREALRRLLSRLLHFGFLSNRLLDSRTFSAVAAAAPGLYDLVRMDFVAQLAAGNVDGRFDLLVVDGPASGHAVALLESPRRIEELLPLGPAASVARPARALCGDRNRFRTLVIALPEELSIAEAAELHAALARIDVAIAPTVVNAVYPERATAEQAAWLALHPASADARLHAARRERQLALAARVASPAGAPVVLSRSFTQPELGASERARLFDRAWWPEP